MARNYLKSEKIAPLYIVRQSFIKCTFIKCTKHRSKQGKNQKNEKKWNWEKPIYRRKTWRLFCSLLLLNICLHKIISICKFRHKISYCYYYYDDDRHHHYHTTPLLLVLMLLLYMYTICSSTHPNPRICLTDTKLSNTRCSSCFRILYDSCRCFSLEVYSVLLLVPSVYSAHNDDIFRPIFAAFSSTLMYVNQGNHWICTINTEI